MLDLQSPADAVSTLLDGITDDQLSAETPCEGTDVAALLGHLLGLATAFVAAARKVDTSVSRPPDPSELELPADWQMVIPRRLEELAAAWRDPAAWHGDTVAGEQPMTGEVAGLVANNELVLHGWDLAVATGQPFQPAEANLRAAWDLVANTPNDPDSRAGLFGPVVLVPTDAPLLDRTLAYSGRDPRWSAAALSVSRAG